MHAVKFYRSGTAALRSVLPDALLLLIARLAIAAIFFLSGRTKVEGLLTITDGTYELFRSEYALPIVSPEVAAIAATAGKMTQSRTPILTLCPVAGVSVGETVSSAGSRGGIDSILPGRNGNGGPGESAACPCR